MKPKIYHREAVFGQSGLAKDREELKPSLRFRIGERLEVVLGHLVEPGLLVVLRHLLGGGNLEGEGEKMSVVGFEAGAGLVKIF